MIELILFLLETVQEELKFAYLDNFIIQRKLCTFFTITETFYETCFI